MSAGAASGIAAIITLFSSLYGMFYLMHRHEAKAEAMIDKWWGSPTLLLFGPVVMLGLSVGAGQLVWEIMR